MDDRIERLERQVMALAEEQGELLGRIAALEEAEAPEAPPLILLDIDGVLADFNAAYYRALTGRRVGAGEAPTLFDRWHWPVKFTAPGVRDRVWTALTEDEDFWFGLPAYPWAEALAQGVAQRAAKADAELVILTSRPDNAAVRSATESWLGERLDLALDDYTLAFAEDKAAWARAQEAPVLWALDDKPEHVAALRDVIAWPHSAWLWAQYWNYGQIPGLTVSSVDQALALLDTAIATQHMAEVWR